MNDAPILPGELHGVFIQSGVGRANIKAIDTSKAVLLELHIPDHAASECHHRQHGKSYKVNQLQSVIY
ncbi:hypothetical protein E2C01_049966 [Portunus trituberculatus]|uniref:Uncharacterized protein n=1 Tax=Portunus trituberculatus TaxID=210409 RepID=A0A5B7GFE1_PORTR|nr:hypothetical protein [Portunus trituberculatus]